MSIKSDLPNDAAFKTLSWFMKRLHNLHVPPNWMNDRNQWVHSSYLSGSC